MKPQLQGITGKSDQSHATRKQGEKTHNVNPIKADVAMRNLHTLISYFQLFILIRQKSAVPWGKSRVNHRPEHADAHS